MKKNINYLDIQLRDMDYLNLYSGMYDRFIDPLGYYSENSFEKGFSEAFNEVKSNLSISEGNIKRAINKISKATKNEEDDFLKGTYIFKVFKKQFQERLAKEQSFMNACITERKNLNFLKIPQRVSGNIKLNSPTVGTEMKEYKSSFNQFIQSLRGFGSEEDFQGKKAIAQILRRIDFAQEINGGLSSAVYSTNTVARYMQRQKKAGNKNLQSKEKELKDFYKQLFDTFFFGVRADKIIGAHGGSMTPDKMCTLLSDNTVDIERDEFEKRFRAFIGKYYQEINTTQLDNFFNNLYQTGSNSLEKIFQYQIKSSSYKFKFEDAASSKYERGVSKNTQDQLKRMLEETFRQIAQVNTQGKTKMSDNYYAAFNKQMQGLVRIGEDYGSNVNGNGKNLSYKTIQETIDIEKGRRTLRLKLKKELKKYKNNPKKQDELINEAIQAGYLTKDELDSFFSSGVLSVDMRHSNVAFERQIRSNFITLLFSVLKKFTKKITKEEIKNILTDDFLKKEEATIREVVFKKLDGSTKTGKLFLDALSAYNFEGVKGLLGEIAGAYEQKARGFQSVAISGFELDKLKMQKNYDIVIEIGEKKFGMQVKNVKNIDSVGRNVRYTLYRTELSLAEKAMYRYFSSDQVKTYRWLFANGDFLEQNGISTFSDVKKLMEANFITAVPEFLRISNAADIGENKIDSDIYLIGNVYYPASYMIFKAYEKVKKEFMSKAKSGKLFRISGSYPKYSYKADPYLSIEKGKYGSILQNESGNFISKERSYRINSKGKMEEQQGNLVVIDKSRILYGKKIIFSGIELTI